MLSPFMMIVPSVWRHLALMVGVSVFIGLFFFERFRGAKVKEGLGIFAGVLPNRVWLFEGKFTVLIGRFLFLVRLSLLPFGIICLHFPVLGIGLRFSLWLSILIFGMRFRRFQLKKEYLGDSSLRVIWVLISVLFETVRRFARAVTLGARIRVNIMIGRILHVVVGELSSCWGIFILSFLEVFVVFVQCYVFILLLCLYTSELE